MELMLAVTGLVTGFVVGLTSTGGGALLTPALVLLLGVPAPVAIGSDLVIATATKSVSGALYTWRREIDWPTVLRLLSGSLPGAFVGLAILKVLPPESTESLLRGALGVLLILAAFATAFRLLRRQEISRAMPRAGVTALLGFLIGVAVSMTSIGSGSLLLCALSLWFPLSARTTVGTDLVHALILSLVGSIGHFAAGRVDMSLVGAVLAGAVPGALAGAACASIVPQRALRACLAAILLAIGVQLISSGHTVAPATTVTSAVSTAAVGR